MTIPNNLSYSADHEWVSVDDGIATVGITEFAAVALGDVVFIGLPKVGDRLTAGEVCGEIESTKSVSDLFSPAGGEVVEINEALMEDCAKINSDPYGAGWLFRIRLAGPLDLMDAQAYAALTEPK